MENINVVQYRYIYYFNVKRLHKIHFPSKLNQFRVYCNATFTLIKCSRNNFLFGDCQLGVEGHDVRLVDLLDELLVVLQQEVHGLDQLRLGEWGDLTCWGRHTIDWRRGSPSLVSPRECVRTQEFNISCLGGVILNWSKGLVIVIVEESTAANVKLLLEI